MRRVALALAALTLAATPVLTTGAVGSAAGAASRGGEPTTRLRGSDFAADSVEVPVDRGHGRKATHAEITRAKRVDMLGWSITVFRDARLPRVVFKVSADDVSFRRGRIQQSFGLDLADTTTQVTARLGRRHAGRIGVFLHPDDRHPVACQRAVLHVYPHRDLVVGAVPLACLNRNGVRSARITPFSLATIGTKPRKPVYRVVDYAPRMTDRVSLRPLR
ncbi:hypothetical protein [Nocardioides sp.]|uniref:hypothetical protein n=1 Tax=Nocardioides sp. TaxID=35761 RepID=UPI00378338D7